MLGLAIASLAPDNNFRDDIMLPSEVMAILRPANRMTAEAVLKKVLLVLIG